MYFPKKPFKAFFPAVIPFIPSIPENLAVRNRITREKTEFSGMDGMNGIIQMRKIPEPIIRIFEQPCSPAMRTACRDFVSGYALQPTKKDSNHG
jgi:hypothetical protein